MLTLADGDVVAERRAADGRRILFTDAARPRGAALPWGAVIVEGADTVFPVRLDEGSDGPGFTFLDLLDIALLRAQEELAVHAAATAVRIVDAVAAAHAAELARRAGRPRVAIPTYGVVEPTRDRPLRFAAAWIGPARIPLCRAAAGGDAGLTLHHLLTIAHQTATDAASLALSKTHLLRAARRLAGEVGTVSPHQAGR